MNATNLQDIADAIREGRFEDVPPEAWNQVADKIELLIPKKKGRPVSKIKVDEVPKVIRKKGRPARPPHLKWNPDIPPQENMKFACEHLGKFMEWEPIDKTVAYLKRYNDIKDMYYELKATGMRAGKIEEELAMHFPSKNNSGDIDSVKTIQKILTAIRIDVKFQRDNS